MMIAISYLIAVDKGTSQTAFNATATAESSPAAVARRDAERHAPARHYAD